MPTSERDIMADNDAHLRHQNPISSDINKAVVPMWDSSDPERAPPPLPMNPSSPSLVSKSHTSSIIQSAHVALAEKAWETGYVTNPPPKRIEYSPERFMMKGVAHKRIKSLQPGSKDLSSPLERIGSVNGPRSPGKAPGWRGSTYTVKDIFIDSRSPEKEPRNIRTGRFSEREPMSSNEEKATDKQKSLRYEENLTDSHKDLNKNPKKEEDSSRSNTPSPDHLDNLSRDLAKTRISLRKPQQSILGENIPPQSATMLALQSMASKEEETRLTNISNSSNALVRTPQTFDAISNQILSLTSIATNLQKEMAQLSRRSKDNATDLISLKEATNARDEDIRRSLRELVHNLSENGSRSSSNVQDSAGFYLNDKLHNYPMPRMKAFSLPRIPSPTGFASSLDRESIISPASYVADGVAIIALLEKVLREMGTREGQKHIMSKISEFLSRDESSTEKKVDDLIMLIKANVSDSDSPSRYGGSVRLNRSRTLSLELAPRLELEFDKSQSMPSSCAVALKSSTNDNKSNNENEQASTIISDDTVNIIRTIKDSVTQGGGLTAEVKALVRELRGEVLGMGREITRKLDEVNEESTKVVASEKEHVSRIVKNGIEDWKTHVDHILREYRRQSSASIASKTSVDHREVCKAVRDAIIEIDKSQSKSLEKEDILNAVRDAWESHKPEIKFQQFWPERDELLNCIKEGIQAFSPQTNTPAISGATREEVYEAVIEGLKCTPLPCADTVANISREEILTAVRQSLEEFEFSSPSSQNKSSEIGVTRDILLDAVKEGLESFDFSSSIKSSLVDANLYLTRHEILEAIQDGLKGLEATAGINELVNKVDESQKDFREESNVNLIDKSEMDTLIGQICEKFKNILDSTRTELEAVTREAKNEAFTSSNATGKLLETTQDGFQKLRADFEDYADKTSGHEIMNTMMDINSNINSLHAELEQLTSNISTGSPAVVLTEIENLRDMLSASNLLDSEAINSDFLTTLQDGLESIKDVISSSLSSPDFVVERTEILSAIKDGFDCAKEEIDISRRFEIDSEPMDILNEIKGGLNELKETMSSSLIPTSSTLDKNEIVNAIMEIKETMSSSLIPTSSRLDMYEILKAINESLDNFKENMSSSLVPTSSGSDKYEILKAINDGLDNFKETMFSSLQTNSPRPHNNEILDAIKDVKEIMSSSLVPTSSGSDKYEILKAINDGLDNFKETMFSSLQTNSPRPHNNEILDAIKDVKETMSTSLIPASSGPDKFDISNTINEGLENIKDIISSSLIPTSSVINKKEVSSIIKDSFDNIKDSILSSLATDSSGLYKDEILNAVKEIKDIVSSSLVFENLELDRNLALEAINDSLGNIKNNISSSLSSDNSSVHKDEILNAIQDVKEAMSSSPLIDSSRLHKDEILDAVKDIKDVVSSTLVSDNVELNRNIVFKAINDGFDSIKNVISSNLPTENSNIHKDEILNAIKDVKEIMSSSPPTDSLALQKDEFLIAVKDIKDTLSSSLASESFGLDKDLVFMAINDGFDIVKDVMSSNLPSDNSGIHKDEIMNAIKDVKETISSSFLSESLELDKDLVLETINDGFDNIKDSLSSINPTDNSGIHKDEILNAIKDVKEKMSFPSTDISGLYKDEVLDAIKDGFENVKEIISSSVMPKSSGIEKDEISNIIRDGLDNILKTMSSSLMPTSLDEDKNLVLAAIKEGLDNIKENISSSLSEYSSGQYKDEILEGIKVGLENVKEAMSSSLIPGSVEFDKEFILQNINNSIDKMRETFFSSLSVDKDEILNAIIDVKENVSSLQPANSGLEKDEILLTITESLESFKKILSTSLVSGNPGLDKNEILNSITDGLENIKESISTSLVPGNSGLNKNEISNAVKDGLESFKEILSTSLVPENPGLNKDEILITITDGLESFKETMSTSLVPGNSGLDKNEISNAVKDGLESFKETISTSLVSGNSRLDKDEISNAVKECLESFKETLSTSLAPENPGLNKDEILITITDSLDIFKETMSSYLQPGNSGLDKDEILFTITDGLESFKETLSTSLAPENPGLNKDEILITITDGLESFKETMSTSLVPGNSGLDKNEISNAVKDGLESLKEILSTSLVPGNSGLDKNEISNAVKDGLECFKETLLTSLAPENPGLNKDEILITITDGLESFKETMSTSLVPGNSGLDKDEILNAVKDGLESLKEILSTSLVPGNSGLDKDEISNAVKDGLESFKETMSTSLVPGNSGLDKDDMLLTITNSMESFKEILSSSLVNNQGLGTDEILHTITHGLESFKEAIPSSLVSENSGLVRDDILLVINDALENLKDSISSKIISVFSESGIDGALQKLTESLEGMKEDFIMQQSLMENLAKGDVLDTIKAGLSNILIEVEKVVNKPSDLAEMGFSKNIFDTIQTGLEDVRADLNRLQKSIQNERTMTELNSSVASSDLLRRDDIESLESLVIDLRTKVTSRDLALPPSEVNQVPLSNIDLTDLEDKLKNIQNSVTDLALRDQILDQESIKKEDLKSIEDLLMNTKVKIEELDTEPSVTKEDFNALEFLIGETRDNLSNLTNHLEDVSKKDDSRILEPIIRDALNGIEKLKDLVEKNSENSDEVKKIDIFAIESTCLDIKNTIDQVLISEIKSLASKDAVKDLEAQFKDFKGQIDKNTETNSSKFEERHLHIIEISEKIKKFLEEFENSVKNRFEEGLTSLDSLRTFLEDFGQVLTRDTKITDEIKSLSDIIKDEFEKSTTLVVGSKVEIDEKFQQTWDKFDADFGKRFCELLLKFDDVRLATEEANKQSDEKTTRIETALRGTEVATEDLKLLASHLSTSLTESVLTLDKNSNTVLHGVDATYNRLQEIHVETKSENQQISDDMAKVLSKIEAIDNTLKEYGPKTSESIKDLVFVANKQFDHSVSSLASLEEMIVEKFPKLDLESSALSLPPSTKSTEKYDDTCVHEKLDKLADEMHIASKSFVQLDLLEKIHQQVIKTAAEVSEYFTTQKKQNSIEYEESKRASEEINNIIEKKLTEKENIEISVIDLRREEENLKKSIFDLRAEKEGLTLQKTRLYSEVSSLETALRIRREELDAMEARAGNLERRIIESVIDHSRSLLITNKNKGRELMSRKRVPSNNGPITSPTRSQASNMTKLAVDLVTGDNISAKKNTPGISRRILSLSQITNNLTPGILKRSHSVKASSGKPRKNSWGGTFSKEDKNLTGNDIQMRENEENISRDIYANLGENLSSNSVEAP
ncbi:hypothetical protein Golomagni_01868 [Golovinomyces magnicellulatus]|nr:hypothetical protein Golomagni_01868 [Golovinomyces magnicellulatus]